MPRQQSAQERPAPTIFIHCEYSTMWIEWNSYSFLADTGALNQLSTGGGREREALGGGRGWRRWGWARAGGGGAPPPFSPVPSRRSTSSSSTVSCQTQRASSTGPGNRRWEIGDPQQLRHCALLRRRHTNPSHPSPVPVPSLRFLAVLLYYYYIVIIFYSI
jgi:hypothetical protein